MSEYLWLPVVLGIGWSTYRIVSKRSPGLTAELVTVGMVMAAVVVIGAAA